MRLATERIAMRRRRGVLSGVTGHDLFMWSCIVASEPVGRELLGLAGCALRLSGVAALAFRSVVATELVSRERLKLHGYSRARRTEEVFGGWSGVLQKCGAT